LDGGFDFEKPQGSKQKKKDATAIIFEREWTAGWFRGNLRAYLQKWRGLTGI
jgi:hypothetical protein